ncbi:ArsS family sensor histidine kinase [Arcobacter arenosus]|uniref:histidine kinase n=1 Tax=Arcobacter arenosus TaxID=2576037 RepID=A0A5R8XYD2_9BACT|nr:ArsS family sensor histidine kinase [Arcobacter arenosus]TLP35873.1 HAMP domain-containing histidine kinase [Arcobacter arenosus]
MSKKNSILFQITLFFITIFLVINLIVLIQLFINDNSNDMMNMKRYFQSVRIIKDSKHENLTKKQIEEKLKVYYTQLANIDLDTVKKYGQKQKLTDHPIDIYIYKDKKYINPKKPKFIPKFEPPKPEKFDKNFVKDEDILFIDNLKDSYIITFWFGILFIIDLLLVWFYYFLYKKLIPLHNLKKEIEKFSKGSLDINTQIKGKDEIAQVSNEFNNAIKKIKDLDDSRKLFLRNILHELKTPITKGKLVSDTLENGKKKNVLQRAFIRLEFLLEEFVKLEQLTSGKMNLVKKEYRVIDLLDQSLDLLLIDRLKVDIYPNGTKVLVDFELFSIALKNLIDNSTRYNTNGNPEIFIKEDCLIIKNQGDALKKPFEEYLKPFNREYESIDKGLGLGLYITNSVIESHGFKLYYQFSKGYHIFKIQFVIPKD